MIEGDCIVSSWARSGNVDANKLTATLNRVMSDVGKELEKMRTLLRNNIFRTRTQVTAAGGSMKSAANGRATLLDVGSALGAVDRGNGGGLLSIENSTGQVWHWCTTILGAVSSFQVHFLIHTA